MYFWRTSIAPPKKKLQLLSPGSPVNSSMLNGPSWLSRSSASTKYSPCFWPTSVSYTHLLEDVTETVNDGTYEIPSCILEPTAVTKENIDKVIICLLYTSAGVLRHHQKRREDIPFGYTWQWTHGSSEVQVQSRQVSVYLTGTKVSRFQDWGSLVWCRWKEQLSLDERLLL